MANGIQVLCFFGAATAAGLGFLHAVKVTKLGQQSRALRDLGIKSDQIRALQDKLVESADRAKDYWPAENLWMVYVSASLTMLIGFLQLLTS